MQQVFLDLVHLAAEPVKPVDRMSLFTWGAGRMGTSKRVLKPLLGAGESGRKATDKLQLPDRSRTRPAPAHGWCWA